MNTINDITTLGALVPVMQSMEFSEVQPEINRSERKFLIPEIGKEIFEEVITALEAATEEDPISDEVALLLSYMQIPVAQFAMAGYAPKLNVIVGSSGLTQDFSDGRKPAFPKDVEAMITSYLDGAHEGLDDLIKFLLENLTDYPTFEDTDAHKASLQFFINNAAEFQTYFNIGSRRRTFLAIKPIMRGHDKDLIKNVTGKDLYDELKEEILAQNISNNNAIILDFIRDAIAHATVADAIDRLNVDISPDFGLTVIAASSSSGGYNKDNRNPSSENSLTRLMAAERTLSEKALQDLKDYLQANAEDFPLYEADEEASANNLEEEKFTNDPDSGIFSL